MKTILKNTAGRYFTIQNGNHTTTANLDLAIIYDPARAAQRAAAFNRDFEDDMQPVPYDTEVLVYYPICAYHASGEYDAKMYVRKIHLGEADGQFSKAIAVCIEGLWFVYARKEGVMA